MNAIHALSEDQFGFRRGKGTREVVGSLRILVERCMQHDEDFHTFCGSGEILDRVYSTIDIINDSF